MKKLFTIALVLLTHMAIVVSGQNAVISINQINDAIPGPNMVVPVFADFSSINQGVAAFTLYIEFDNRVLGSPGLLNQALAGMQSSTSTSGNTTMLTVIWEDMDNTTQLNGKLFDLEFNYKGGNSGIVFSTTNTSTVGDSEAELLPRTLNNGWVAQISITPGISVNNGTTFNSEPYKTVNIPVYGYQMYNFAGFSFELELQGASFLTGNMTAVNRRAELVSAGSWTANYLGNGRISIAWTKSVTDNVSVPDGAKLFDLRFAYTYGNSAISFAGSPQIAENDPPWYPAFGNSVFSNGAINTTKVDPAVTFPTGASITYGQALSAATLNGGSASYTGAPDGGLVEGTFAYNDPSITPNAGTYGATVVFTPINTTAYNVVTGTVDVEVAKINQTITWNNPAAITYGTLLSATQLNATVAGVVGGSVAGELTYNPSAGTMLGAGTQTLNVTAAATQNYNEATAQVSLVVNKVNQTITWSNPAAITYGTLLSATQLNATVAGVVGGSVAGELTYSPAIGTMLGAGTQTLNVTAAATQNYNEATAQVSLVVNKANQTITWSNPAAITYGTLLSATQLNATVAGVVGGSVAGELTYSPAIGTMLGAGTQTLNVTAAATQNYNEATAQVSLVVNKANQTITWSNPAAIIYGTLLSATQLNATVAGVVGGSVAGELTYSPAIGTMLGAGTQTLNVTAAATQNYNEATAQVSLVVNKANQTITWSNPAAITYGTLLSATQLNATVAGLSGGSAAGTLTYSPAIGTMLGAGTQTLNVTAAATQNYNEANAQVSLVVNKANQTITWSNPAAITYGTLLSATQLNAAVAGVVGGSVAGELTYSPAIGTMLGAGTQTLNVTAAATQNYNEATAQVSLVVNKANQTITWSNPAAIIYGTLLSATQLNATVAGVVGGSVAGELTYSPAIGTMLGAGTQTLNVTAAATQNYNEATAQVSLVVNKANQTITWSNPAAITYGTLLSATQLNATVAGLSGGSAAGTLTYSPAIGTMLGAGTQTLNVTAAATQNYNEATAQVSIVVNKANQTITWNNPVAITYGTLLSATQLNAIVAGLSGGSAPGALTYNPSAGTMLGAGTQTLNVTAAATQNYNEATAQVSLVVNKVNQTITWSNPAAITYGTLLSATQLNATVAGVVGGSVAGELTYSPAIGTMLGAGTQTLNVTAAATQNYNEATAQVSLVVNKANQTITWSNPAAITYGTLLSATQLNATVAGLSGGSAAGTLTYSPAIGTMLGAGTQTLNVTAAATQNYNEATAQVSIVVNKANQTITWNNPVAITYGTLLSATQLNAIVAGLSGGSAPGALTYNPSAGTMLGAGTQTLNVTAAATQNYNEATAQVSLVVNKVNQTITWSNPAAITYGTLLSATQLNATVAGVVGGSVAGELTYSPAIGTMLGAGTQTLNVTAAATQNYNEATAQVSLVVNKANQTITWSNPAAIIYGTLLSATQLNATVAGVVGGSVAGELTYSPAIGTMLGAGTQTLNVTAAATQNYNEATAQVSLVVNKANQTITWSNPAAITYGTLLSATQLNATVAGLSGGSAAGTLTYSPAIGTMLGAGTQTLNVTAAATQNYNEANAQVSLVVNKANQTITWSNPVAITYGAFLSETQLNAAVAGVVGGSVAGELTYSPAIGTMLGAGTQTLNVTAAATQNYNEATAQVSLVVNKANQTITWSNPAAIIYGTLLSATQLNATVAGVVGGSVAGELTYSPAIGTMLGAGTQTLNVTAAATQNYNEATAQVSLVVNKANQTISWSNPDAIPYGTPLTSAQLNASVMGVSGGSAPGSLLFVPPAGTFLLPGTHLLTVKALETINYNEAVLSVHIIVTESNAASLSGQLKIFCNPNNINPFNYPNNFYVQLYDGDVPVGTPQLIRTGSQLNLQGLYQFNGLDIGKNYTLRVWETSHNNLISSTWTWNNWSGISALDAFIIQLMIIESPDLNAFPWIGNAPYNVFSDKVADVNNSNSLTSIDPLLLMYRLVGYPMTNPFPGGRHNFVFAGKRLPALGGCIYPMAPDMLFVENGVYLPDSEASSVYHEVQITDLQQGLNVFNIYMGVAGDMNGSFMSNTSKSSQALNFNQQINTSKGATVDIPVLVNKEVSLNAITIGLGYDKNLIRINSISGFELYHVNHDEGTVKIAWSEIQSKKFSAGEVLFYINATVLAEMQGNEPYVELLPMTELNESGSLLNTTPGLTIRSLSTLDMNPASTESIIVHHFYPNPFSETGNLNISLPAKGKLNISVFNQFGQTVHVLAEEVAEAGLFNLQLSRAQLNGSGIYTYRVMLQTDVKQFVVYGNVILLK